MVNQPRSGWKYSGFAVMVVIGSWMLYAVLSMNGPSASNSFNLTSTQMALLRLTIIIPLFFIWFVAIRGIIAFKGYATILPAGSEARSLNLISDGLLWLIGYLVTQTVLGAILPYYRDTQYYDYLAITRDHIPPLASLIAFGLIYRGSHYLRDIAKFTTWTRGTLWVMAGYLVFAILLVLLFSRTPTEQVTNTSRNSLALVSHNILLLTMVLPYIIAWFMGLLAAINIGKYANQVKGVLYKTALKDLMRGLVAIIGFASVVQVLSFSAAALTGMSVGLLLFIVYVLLVLYAVGFMLLRQGAKKLTRIELAQ